MLLFELPSHQGRESGMLYIMPFFAAIAIKFRLNLLTPFSWRCPYYDR
jgi:hypothetical protein